MNFLKYCLEFIFLKNENKLYVYNYIIILYL